MTTLTITHSPAAGVLLEAPRRGVVGDVLRTVPAYFAQWRWSDDLDCWHVRHTRDKLWPQVGAGVNKTAEVLRAAGFTVTVERSDETRPVAEREQDRAERAELRADYHSERASMRKAEGDATFAAARERASHMVGPILVGHHSERRHRRDLARLDRMDDRAGEAWKAAEYHGNRAAAAEATQRHREAPGTTLRRVERLSADLRAAERERDGYTTPGRYGHTYPPATGEHREHVQARIEDLTAQIEHWRAHLDQLREEGVEFWGPDDFARGDFVLFRHGCLPVLRVNPKSVTVPHIEPRLARHGHTWKVPYDEVQGRLTAEEAAARGIPTG